MSLEHWDEKYDPTVDGFRIGPRLCARGADTQIEALPEKNAEHQWHYPRLTAEQLDELAFDAREAVINLNGRLTEMGRVQRDNERLRATVLAGVTEKDFCMWCGREARGFTIVHTHDCRACTPDGAVR